MYNIEIKQMLKNILIKLRRSTKYPVTFSIILFIVLLTITWLLPIEENLSLVNSPNQSATTKIYSKNYSLQTSGAFLYRINTKAKDLPGDISIKLDTISAEVDIQTVRGAKTRLTLLGIAPSYRVEVNGIEQKLNVYDVNKQFDSQLGDNTALDYNVVKSDEFLYKAKGYYVDASLRSGQNKITITPGPSTSPLNFSIGSDLHSGYRIGFSGLVQMIRAKPDFIVLNGDIVDYGNKAEYLIASALTEASLVPVITNIGNHENWQSGQKFYSKYFGHFNKSFTYKDALFVFVDNHTGYISNSQFNWLASTLSASKESHKFVFAHMPAIDAHTKVFDSHTYRYPQMKHNLYSQDQSNRLIQILNQYNVDALFSGHDHIFNNFKLGNVTQANSGALGGKIRKADTVTYLNVSTNKEGVRVTNVPVEGKVEATNQEHSSRLQFAKLMAKPFLADKKIRIELSLILFLLIFGVNLIVIKHRKHK